MKRLVYTISICLLICNLAKSQNPSWQWAKNPAVPLAPYNYPATCTDPFGNTYVAGGFEGTATFATLPNPTILTSAGEADIFIVKYDPSGNVVWAKRAGGTRGDVARGIEYDGHGNIYIVGGFSENTNFDGTIIFNAATIASNAFIAKFNATSGNFLWVRHGAASSPYSDQQAFDVAVDEAGDAYVTGYYGIITFDGLPTMNTVGWWDLFVVKYNGNGVAQWQTSAGSSEPGYYAEGGNSIAVDGSGNVFVTGNINGSTTYPTHFGSIDLASNGGGGFYEYNFFLAKYNQTTSSWEWAVNGGGTTNDYGKSVSLDNQGNAYVSGYFEGTGTFGSSTLTATGGRDYFSAKYTTTGTQQWIQPVQGVGYFAGNTSKVDASGNFYFAGTFDGTITVGDQNLTSDGYDNAYISAWSSSGNFVWVKKIPGNYYSHINGLDVESNGNVHVVTVFDGTETFDCTVLDSYASGVHWNLGVGKLGTTSNGPEAPIIAATSNTVCNGSGTTLSITSGNLNNATEWKWYSGSCGGTLIGTGTSVTVSPSVATTYYVRGEGGCSAPGTCAGITINIGTVNVTIPDAKTMNYTGIPNNTVYPAYAPASSITLTAQPLGTAPYTYSWSNGATTQSFTVSPTVTTTFTVTVTDANGCTGSTSKEVIVKDVNCSNGKVYMCHITGSSGHVNTICIDNSAVASHLAAGCSLGECTGSRSAPTNIKTESKGFEVDVLPNPSSSNFKLVITANETSPVSIRILDVLGRVIEVKENVSVSESFSFGDKLKSGVYFAEIIQGKNRKVIRLLKK